MKSLYCFVTPVLIDKFLLVWNRNMFNRHQLSNISHNKPFRAFLVRMSL